MPTPERTIVGIPFYEGECSDVLERALEDIDRRLRELGVDAKIVVGVNGPSTSRGNFSPPPIERSSYNADIEFIKTPPGLVYAEKTIARKAMAEGYPRIFLTDVDISRLPGSLSFMWREGNKRLVGANYCAYPPEILEAAGFKLSEEEKAWARIFEADKHPLAREFTGDYRPELRLKGSLLLVDTELVLRMFGQQNITSDSRMNLIISDNDKQVVQNAAFLYFPRVDLADHVCARLRHFLAAATGGIQSWTDFIEGLLFILLT